MLPEGFNYMLEVVNSAATYKSYERRYASPVEPGNRGAAYSKWMYSRRMSDYRYVVYAQQYNLHEEHAGINGTEAVCLCGLRYFIEPAEIELQDQPGHIFNGELTSRFLARLHNPATDEWDLCLYCQTCRERLPVVLLTGAGEDFDLEDIDLEATLAQHEQH